MIKRIWNAILSSGIPPDLAPRSRRFAQNLNGISVFVGLWLGLLIPVWLPGLPDTKVPLLSSLAGSLFFLLTPLFHRLFGRTVATWGYALGAYAVITVNAWHLGHDSWNQLFLLAAILIGFYLFETLASLIATTVIGLSLFAGLEIAHALGLQAPLRGALDDSFFTLALYIDIYNIVFLTIALAFFNHGRLRQTEQALDREKEISERLLLNVLPREIAERLKRGPALIADRIPEATVLFADLVGFTPMSAKMDAKDLVELLGGLFSAFDREARLLGIEKIKTIGDAYMVAAGVPSPRPDHAEAGARMALAMRERFREFRTKHPDLEIRIGLHCGPVVAGVIGESKFIYDLWGDTVNTASRMESHGAPGAIHVSDDLRLALGDRFVFEDRGLQTIKGKGEVRTWFLVGEASPAR